MPDGLEPPALNDVELTYWEAFRDLNTERQTGMAKGQIPWSAIQRYAKAMIGVPPHVFTEIIRAMDDVFVYHKPGETREFSREMMRRR